MLIATDQQLHIIKRWHYPPSSPECHCDAE